MLSDEPSTYQMLATSSNEIPMAITNRLRAIYRVNRGIYGWLLWLAYTPTGHRRLERGPDARLCRGRIKIQFLPTETAARDR
jgi:hypothetical protein